MVSKIEDALLRCSGKEDKVRSTLFNKLDKRDIGALRVVSRTFHDLIDHSPERLFRELYISAPWPEYVDTETPMALAPFCHTLIIQVRVEPEARATTKWTSWLRKTATSSLVVPSGNGNSSARQRWKDIRQALRPHSLNLTALQNGAAESSRLSLPSTIAAREKVSVHTPELSSDFNWVEMLSVFTQVRAIEIRCTGDTGWPGRTEIETTLTCLRVALERCHHLHLRSVSLAPMHAMGIIHLSWANFSAFTSARAARCNMWRDLKTLEIQLHNPFNAKLHLGYSQQVFFKKALHGYVSSFASTLKCFRFLWLDEEGPSPMLLDLETDLQRAKQTKVVWRALEELWLGNVSNPHQTIRALSERTLKDINLRTLKSTHGQLRAAFQDPEAWMRIVLGAKKRKTAGSSLYSQ